VSSSPLSGIGIMCTVDWISVVSNFGRAVRRARLPKTERVPWIVSVVLGLGRLAPKRQEDNQERRP
jgi:hypothetical protein